MFGWASDFNSITSVHSGSAVSGSVHLAEPGGEKKINTWLLVSLGEWR